MLCGIWIAFQIINRARLFHWSFLSPPLIIWSRLFIILPDVGNAHIWVKPVHLVLELAVTETQAKAGRPAHFVNVQNLLDDPLQKKCYIYYEIHTSFNPLFSWFIYKVTVKIKKFNLATISAMDNWISFHFHHQYYLLINKLNQNFLQVLLSMEVDLVKPINFPIT